MYALYRKLSLYPIFNTTARTHHQVLKIHFLFHHILELRILLEPLPGEARESLLQFEVFESNLQ